MSNEPEETMTDLKARLRASLPRIRKNYGTGWWMDFEAAAGKALPRLLDEIERLEGRECRHGWRGASVAGVVEMACPTCQGQVFIGEGGHLTCGVLRCTRPDVGDVLQEIQAERDELRAQLAKLERTHAAMRESTDQGDALYGALNDALDSVEMQAAQLAHREADSARLDWLNEGPALAAFLVGVDDYEGWRLLPRSDASSVTTSGPLLSQGATLREAIDAARLAPDSQDGTEEEA